ncbi:MAG: cyclic nucleotide-binding domain-containing protein [Acidobacteriota bacterium]
MTVPNLFDQYMVRFKAGDIVFRDGERGEEMYIVHAGIVEVCKELDSRRTVLSRLEKGDFFGEMAILENLPRSATVEVVEDAILIRINKATFEALLKSNIEIAIRMLRKYSIRLREANMEIERLHQRKKAGQIRITSRGPSAGMPVGVVPELGDRPEPSLAEVEMAEVAPPRDEIHEAAPPRAATTMPAEEIAAQAPEPPRMPVGTITVRDSGRDYPFFINEVTVGRKDPVTGSHPDIDLSGEDRVRSVSRRHAKIILQDGQFFVMEEVGVANGTFLNGERLPTGAMRPLEEADEIKFGLVAAVFRKGGSATSSAPAE